MAINRPLELLGFAPKYEERFQLGVGWEITVTPPSMLKLPAQKITLNENQYQFYKLWRAGQMLIQDAFPELSAAQREVLMTGIGDADFTRIMKVPSKPGYVMVCQGLASGPEGNVCIGQFLEEYDIEAYDGRGSCSWTNDPRKAIVFASKIEALEVWNTQSTKRPLRPDGRPNKPLTAFTVEVIEVNPTEEDDV